ncbi:uncharacterized protein V6R79_014487 [Siganus canaliculatus]
MDVEDSGQTVITLLIKTPNQAHEDQRIGDVHLNWTVKDLKTHLSDVYPSRPPVSSQRLIYAGKLLPDHLHIRDLFRQLDIIPTLHLVCALGNQPQGELGARAKTRVTEQPPSSSSRSSPTVPASSSSRSTAPAPSPPELRQRRQTSADTQTHTHTPVPPSGSPSWPPAAAMTGAPQMTQPAFPTYSLYSPQQLLWLQQIYARQYYLQYHAALAAAGTAPPSTASTIGHHPPVPAHPVPVPAPLANQDPINNLPANQNPVQNGALINPGEANQNMRMNAQGGPVMEDEEDMDRDWLDWLYSAARFGVLLMIVYFNSNLSRFLLVMSTLLLMYLHTAGWFPFRRQVQVQGPDQPPVPEEQQNRERENENRNQNLGDELADRQGQEPAAAVDGVDGPGPMTAVLVPPHRVSIMWTAWVFFKTFFSSLIPEVHQGVAN